MKKAPYSKGFITLSREESGVVLPVQGKIPEWLNGVLLRNGPGRFEFGEHSYNHWFDGLAMVRKFRFSGGEVEYSGRYLQTKALREAQKKHMISRGEFGTSSDHSYMKRLFRRLKGRTTDNCNVSINRFGNRMAALADGARPRFFDPETLKTEREYRYRGDIGAQVSTPHPHFDFERACHYNCMIAFGPNSFYKIVQIDSPSNRQHLISSIPARPPSFIHSFAMTRRYLILTEIPFFSEPLKMIFSGKPFIQNYTWNPKAGISFHIIDKETGDKVASSSNTPFFVFHHVNAFEEGNTIILDLIGYDGPGILDQLLLEKLRSDESITAIGKLIRFSIPLNKKKDASCTVLTSSGMELPRINYPRISGKPYRYVFGSSSRRTGNFLDSLVKVDLKEHKEIFWEEPNCYPGEPVFISSPNSQEEDGGLIVSVVFDAEKTVSFLLILDAFSWREIARAVLPHHIPFGFHGNFFPALSGPKSLLQIHP